jgi:hypothetical protein
MKLQEKILHKKRKIICKGLYRYVYAKGYIVMFMQRVISLCLYKGYIAMFIQGLYAKGYIVMFIQGLYAKGLYVAKGFME